MGDETLRNLDEKMNKINNFIKNKTDKKELNIFFEGNETHQATTCTDEKYKIVINFNYQ